MLRLIEQRNERELAQRQLVRIVRLALPKKERRRITWRPSSIDVVVNYNDEIWFAPVTLGRSFKRDRRKKRAPVYWNSFGSYKSTGSLGITVETNILLKGNSKRVSGFFARDPVSNDIYLMHSGKIGGGAKGVGKNSFLIWSARRAVAVEQSDGSIREGIVVASLSGERAFSAIRRFVESAAEFKRQVKRGLLQSRSFRQSLKDRDTYNREFSGRKKGRHAGAVDYVSRHGEVVHALRDLRMEAKRRDEIVPNSSLVDLYVKRRGVLTEVYEVKTEISRTSMYGAIGQLMVHGGSSKSVLRHVVLPKGKLPQAIAETLDRLGIRVLRYSLLEGGVAFDKG
jgi:hypothetical protein